MERININTDSRIEKFRKKLAEKNIDAAIITKRENYIYLSGFTGTSAVLLITMDSCCLITDFRYIEQAQKQAQGYEIIKYQGNIITAINDVLKSKSIDILGFEDTYITYERYTEFKEKLEAKELKGIKDTVELLRNIKDDSEIELIKAAVKLADDAFSHVVKYIKPGITEMDIAAEIEFYMKKNGAKGPSFETIVASGERASMPHGVASGKKIQNGDVITMDYGAIYEEYCSDMTRTVFLGEPNEELKKIYNIVLEAQKLAAQSAKEGLLGREIDAVARNYIADAGFGDHFGHGLGHGVGLEIHEEPRLSVSGNVKMQKGMVVTVEPGIYVSGLGGVRIEDIIVIGEESAVTLTKSTKEMIII